MVLEKFHLYNYKSHLTSHLVDIGSGVNLVIGRNNVGKTAILEALTLNFGSVPHASPDSQPIVGHRLNTKSKVEVTFVLSRSEVVDIATHKLDEVIVPAKLYDDGSSALRFFNDLPEECFIRCTFINGILSEAWFEHYQAHPNYDRSLSFAYDEDEGCLVAEQEFLYKPAVATIAYQIVEHYRKYIYRVHADLRVAAEASTQGSEVLRPDASNLPNALLSVQSRRQTYNQLLQWMHELFPEIAAATAKAKNDGAQVVIMIEKCGAEGREDLLIPLSESGTGVAQALVIFCALLDSPYAVLIIDEPQSFLHPGAIRRLMEILRQESEKQIIIATHSPIVLTNSEPTSIHIVELEREFESSVRPVEGSVEESEMILRSVGARVADLFGAENVMWVEGETEERCFPTILRSYFGTQLGGTIVRGVKSTGDFDRRDADRIIDIYNKLTSVGDLIPPAIAFVFDREDRSEQELVDLKRKGKGKVHFLSKRMFENYLIHSGAIAETLNAELEESTVTTEVIDQWLSDAESGGDFLPRETADLPEDWGSRVHAGQLLNRLFKELTQERCIYRKTTHGPLLMKWLLDNEPEYLRELAEDLKGYLKLS